MEIARHITAIEHEGVALAGVAQRSGLDVALPTCPGWRMRDLLAHLGYVHRWAAGHVASARADSGPQLTEAEILSQGPADGELIAWFREGHADLVATLRSADPAVTCWTFLPAPSPLAFWARRQAHETTIHRVDAELASGAAEPADPLLAADGVDELLLGFASRRRPKPAAEPPSGLRIEASDTGDVWLARIGDGGNEVVRGDGGGQADCSVRAPAFGLYLLLWNRCDAAAAAASVSGDAGILAAWHTRIRVRWS